MSKHTKVLIIGTPAGYIFDIFPRAMLKSILVQGLQGGQLTITTDVEKIGDVIQGPY